MGKCFMKKFDGEISYPLGLLFKDENKSADLAEVLQHFQKIYVPKGPDGLSKILVGGDRLSEANSRTLQWAYADGINIEERLDGLRTGMPLGCFSVCSNVKQGPQSAYNTYKHFFITDTTALLLTAAMEHFELQDVAEIPESFVPEEIASGLTDVRRTWLHAKSAEIVEKFVLLGDLTEAMTGLCEASEKSTETKDNGGVHGVSHRERKT